MKNQKNYWIQKLNLEAHQEGGYFHQNYLSQAKSILKDNKTKSLMSSIYFLLTADSPSHFHRLQSDEIWYFHYGATISIHLIHPNGVYECIKLGLDDDAHLQYVVPAGTIFGSSVEATDVNNSHMDFAVVGCAVTPAFTYEEFELFTQKQLLTLYPNHQHIIEKLAYKTL